MIIMVVILVPRSWLYLADRQLRFASESIRAGFHGCQIHLLDHYDHYGKMIIMAERSILTE